MAQQAAGNEGKQHQELLREVSRQLTKTEDLLTTAVPEVAELMAKYLPAECVCIFFRRKTTEELQRYAFVRNNSTTITRAEVEQLSFDKSYKNTADTLLHTLAEQGLPGINYSESEINDPNNKVNKTIVNAFRDALSSQMFKHLIVVRLHVGDDQLGAIRVINRLAPDDPSPVSNAERFHEYEYDLVVSIGVMLALAFENHLKSEKLATLGEYFISTTNPVTSSPDVAVEACLESLVSEKIGFPLATWRAYGEDGVSKVAQHAFPKREPIQLLRNLQLKSGQELQSGIGRTGKYLIVPDRFRFKEWAQANQLGAVYVHEIQPWPSRRFSLEVYARSIRDFDTVSVNVLAIYSQALERTLSRLPAPSPPPEFIIGESKEFQEAIKLAETLARGSGPILIQCATGTGKEVFARHIHQHSSRNNQPFIPVNCSALHANLEDSQLFGHVAGAFTNAVKERRGAFERASNGILFLDEIGDIPLNQQAKLLRALQENKIEKVGGEVEIEVNVRVIAATNKSLPRLVKEKRFRADLYYRLKGGILRLPRLRGRGEDIRQLADHFLRRHTNLAGEAYSGFTEEAYQALMGYRWPGNVRELERAIETAVLFVQGHEVTLNDLLKVLPKLAGNPERFMPLKEFKEGLDSTLSSQQREWAIHEYVVQVRNKSRTDAEATRRLACDEKTFRKYQNMSIPQPNQSVDR